MSGTLPTTTRLGPVELTVRDLDRSLAFYTGPLGLLLHERDDDRGRAALGAGADDVLILTEDSGAQIAGRHAGLYHVAVLYPSRLELARAAARLALTRTPIEGASDHKTHEAIYLPDPDGNGLELAADRPRDEWPDLSGPLENIRPQALDMDALLGLLDEDIPAHIEPGFTTGHLHLHVGDLDAADRFYREVVGFEPVMALPGSASFLSAGGYHHHVAVNVWRGPGVPPAPADAVGLRHWTVYVPGDADVDAVRARAAGADVAVTDAAGGALLRDPSGNAVLVAVDPA
ncbi:MAG: VOC family protein [Solirubrobacteraceae bacterium]|nr:VOC family protein [Solirubrobacteraceae bacterium]